VSSVVTTITPFLNRELLLAALQEIGCKHTERTNEILLLDRKDYRGGRRFLFTGGRFLLQYDSDEAGQFYRPLNDKNHKSVTDFLLEVECTYNQLYAKRLEELERERLEEERLRLEEERKTFVKKQKETIIARAKARGYSVREEYGHKEIKLVLVRNVY